VDALLAVAADLTVPPAQVAVAWLLRRAATAATALVPVIGPRTVSQLDDYLGALDVRLDEEQYQRLDQVSRVPLGRPHDLVATQVPALLGGPDMAFRPPFVPVA
jgi:aryl-alcohol dehydrogenase-like predicted oxidoreductase